MIYLTEKDMLTVKSFNELFVVSNRMKKMPMIYLLSKLKIRTLTKKDWTKGYISQLKTTNG